MDGQRIMGAMMARAGAAIMVVGAAATVAAAAAAAAPQLGLGTGIPRVGKSEPVPVPANTVPVTGTGTYRTVICAVSYETPGITSTRGFYFILIFIFTKQNQRNCRKSKTEPAGLGFSE
jgi:hypothetical protein